MNGRSTLLLTGKMFIPCLTAVLLTGCAEPGIQDLQNFVATTKAASPGKKLDPLPQVEPYRPFNYSAQGLKNPFTVSEFAKQAKPPEFDNGIRPDPQRPREPLEKYALGSLVMVGTIQKDGLWGLIKAPDGVIHRVIAGNYLGTDYGKITAVTKQRIDIKEIVSTHEAGWSERDNYLSLAE